MTQRNEVFSRTAQGFSAECVDEMDAFDRLPDSVRRSLWDTCAKFMAISFTPHMGLPSSVLCSAIARTNSNEMLGFALQYKMKHGHVLPHVAAHATLMHHNSGAGSRKNRVTAQWWKHPSIGPDGVR